MPEQMILGQFENPTKAARPKQEKRCENCRYCAALARPYERSDGAIIYGYCFGDGDKDYSRTCEGCRFIITEPWLKDVQSFRCGADGRCKGYIVGIERLLPCIPAWCPQMDQN